MSKPPSLGEKTGVNSALGLTPSTEDFVLEATVSDMFEIESSRMAVQKGDAQLKSFAEKMIADHIKTAHELKDFVQSGAVKQTLPHALDDAHRKKLNKLRELEGGDFVKRYGHDQVNAHEEAVSLFERYADGGDNAQLKAWAAQTLPALQHHLKMARQLVN